MYRFHRERRVLGNRLEIHTKQRFCLSDSKDKKQKDFKATSDPHALRANKSPIGELRNTGALCCQRKREESEL